MTDKTWLIGIDPSLKNAGAAINCPSTGERALFSGSWYAVIDWLSAQKILGSAIAIIEDPNMDKTLFGGWPPVRAEISKFMEKKSSYGEIQSIFARAAKQAQNVGENKASAKVFIDLFRKHGIPYGSIAPSTRDRADRDLAKMRNLGIEMLVLPTKTTAHQFQTLTGFGGRSNEHSRDAAMLVFGKSINWGKVQVQVRQQYEQNR